jgi:hypothetical protein
MITDQTGFNVVCTSVAKAEEIEACWFSYAEWTEADAMRAFAIAHGLAWSEVAVEKED